LKACIKPDAHSIHKGLCLPCFAFRVKRQGSGIQSDEDEVGVLQDVIVADETWSIAYLLIRLLPSGDLVLLATDALQAIDLPARRIYVAVSRDAIIHSPIIASAAEPITPEFEQRLKGYYEQYSR
jgi:sporulation protein YlmC with PRC-barrel domain